MNNENDEEDHVPQYVKDERAKQNKFADFMVGFFVIGSFILIICIYTGIIDMGNGRFSFEIFFPLVGCGATGFFLYKWVIKPILEKYENK